MKPRVVVTGMGLVSPIGNDLKTNWDSLLAAKSGIAGIEGFDVSQFPVRIAGQLKDFSAEGIVERSEIRRLDLFNIYAMVAAAEAVQDAGIDANVPDAERIATYVGSGIGGIEKINENAVMFKDHGVRRISPFFVPGSIVNMAGGLISIKYGFKGPSMSMATACTTGTHAVGLGYRSIVYGEADLAVVGGSEAPVNPLAVAGFIAVRALSERNDEPEKASRPWDKDRDGFVLGEGAGILVLENYERAKKRGAKIYAEVTGFGMSSDGYHMTSPPEDGSGAALAMDNAIKDAKLAPDQIQHVNAHATSTNLGDVAEARAMKKIFGAHTPKLAVSGTKSMTGHLLGAAGAIEAIYTVKAVQEGIVPPTINLENPEEECEFDIVVNEARQHKIEHALSNSFGFGGTNASIIIRKH